MMTELEQSAPASDLIYGISTSHLDQNNSKKISTQSHLTKSGTIESVQHVDSPYCVGVVLHPGSLPKLAKTESNKCFEHISQKTLLEQTVLKEWGQYTANIDQPVSPISRPLVLREGQPLTVSKVGNNGRIYLRPIIYPANQRYGRPSKFFSTRSPIDNLSSDDCEDQETRTFSLFSTDHAPTIPITPSSTLSTRAHMRPHSFSTVNETQARVSDSKFCAPSNISSNAQDKFPYLSPLEMPLPSHGLGSHNSNLISPIMITKQNPIRHSEISPNSCLSVASGSNYLRTQTFGSKNNLRKSTIIPETFDALTLKPFCDHPSVVQYSIGGQISAATPARLVAEITSPALIDYDLLSDFFLTFRSFLKTSDLMHMFVARMEWSLLRIDSIGIIVSVRTFVAIRHWILNYFVEDFLKDWDLRKLFCHLINDFINQIIPYPVRFRVPLKILGELKKCWRKVCAMHWESYENVKCEEILGPISPGGRFHTPHSLYSQSSFDYQSWNEKKIKNKSDNQHIFKDSKKVSQIVKLFNDSLPIETLRIKSPYSECNQSIMSISPQSSATEHLLNSQEREKKLVAENYDLSHRISENYMNENDNLLKSSSKPHKKLVLTQQQSLDYERSHRSYTQPNQKKYDRNFKSCLKTPVSSGYGRNKFSTSRRQLTNLVNREPVTKISISCNSNPQYFKKQKENTANSRPVIKKLVKNVRRVFNTTTSQIFSSLHSQKCVPCLVPFRTRESTSKEDLISSNSTTTFPILRPFDSSKRIDTLSVEIASDLEKASRNHDNISAKFNAKPCFNREKSQLFGNTNSTPQLNSVIQLDPSTHNGESLSRATNYSKSICFNDSSTSKSFVLSGFSYYPSVDAFATAYMRPSDGPISSNTPDRFLNIYQHETGSTPSEIYKKMPLSKEIPSLTTDSFSAEGKRLSSNFSKFEDNNQPTVKNLNQTEKSPRLHTSHQSSSTRWTSWHNFETKTFLKTSSEHQGHLSTLITTPMTLKSLRRRPGGNLRSENDLGAINLTSHHRPKSTGSIPNQSMRGSSQKIYDLSGMLGNIFIESGKEDQTSFSEQMVETFSKKYISIFGSHLDVQSTFEKEFQLLAHLPDDERDDGTAESALLKLEGKFDKIQQVCTESTQNSNNTLAEAHLSNFESSATSIIEGKCDRYNSQKHNLDAILARFLPTAKANGPKLCDDVKSEVPIKIELQNSIKNPLQATNLPNTITSDKYALLLGNDDDNRSENIPLCHWPDRYIFQDTKDESQIGTKNYPTTGFSKNTCHSPTKERDMVELLKKKSQSKLIVHDTFLNIESDCESGSSNNINISMPLLHDTKTDSMSRTSDMFLPIQFDTNFEDFTNSFRQSPFSYTTQAAKTTESFTEAEISHTDNVVLKPELINSESNSRASSDEENLSYRGASLSMNPLGLHRISHPPRKMKSSHLPFILAFSSDILAQQFTLVEKYIASEINWKDLIEIRWKDSPSNFTSWLTYLKSRNSPCGIHASITRSELMVKWVVSECVLTKDLMERASCLVKLIHIADKCRKYQNFATMIQIIIALTSEDIAYLEKTWVHVPTTEIQTLQQLATVVFPSNRNHLENEMIKANLSKGCIPFVQIFTRNLLENYEKPTRILNSSGSESLINFDKCRTNAVTVKSLMRLLEASQNYQFSCIDIVYERCYWIAALSDEQILAHKKLIQH